MLKIKSDTMNETINETINQVGSVTAGNVVNLNWADGITQFVNSALGSHVLTPNVVTYFFPFLTVILLLLKFNTVMTFIQSFGQAMLIIFALFFLLKMFSVV